MSSTRKVTPGEKLARAFEEGLRVHREGRDQETAKRQDEEIGRALQARQSRKGEDR